MKVLISGASGSFSLELVKHLVVFDTDTGSLRYGEINKQQNSKLLNCRELGWRDLVDMCRDAWRFEENYEGQDNAEKWIDSRNKTQ